MALFPTAWAVFLIYIPFFFLRVSWNCMSEKNLYTRAVMWYILYIYTYVICICWNNYWCPTGTIFCSKLCFNYCAVTNNFCKFFAGLTEQVFSKKKSSEEMFDRILILNLWKKMRNVTKFEESLKFLKSWREYDKFV